MATTKDKTKSPQAKKVSSKFIQQLLSEGFKLDFNGNLEFRIKMKVGDDISYTITKEHFDSITLQDIFQAMMSKSYVEGIQRMKVSLNSSANQFIGSLRA